MKSKVFKSYTKESHSINDDITEEIKIDEEKILKNLYINEKENLKRSCLYENKSKKLIFLVNKRIHSDDIKDSQTSFIERESKKIHDRNEKDNIITKIQIHYRNFLISFINEVIQKVIFEDCYISKSFDKILNLKEYLFNKIDHHFKSNTKREDMQFAESLKIKELISPSVALCKKYNIENRNKFIMEKIEALNNPILNQVLNNKYLYFFDLYYNGKRNINIKEGLYSIDLELSHKIKLFNDLIGNYQDDEKYTANLKKFAVSNFSNIINDKNKI